MNEQEKRFKIIKKESYEEQISKENKNAVHQTILLAISASAAIAVFLTASNGTEIMGRILFDMLGIMNSTFAAFNLNNLIENICKKINLQSKVDDINAELEMFKDEQKRGIKR